MGFLDGKNAVAIIGKNFGNNGYGLFGERIHPLVLRNHTLILITDPDVKAGKDINQPISFFYNPSDLVKSLPELCSL